MKIAKMTQAVYDHESSGYCHTIMSGEKNNTDPNPNHNCNPNPNVIA
jgi:hypothetical protein